MGLLLTFEGLSSIGDVKFEAITARTSSQRCAPKHRHGEKKSQVAI